MFSPYYAWAGRAEPENHVCINAALYGANARWAMTERGAGALDRGASHFAVGPSALRWDGAGLAIALDERCAPWPQPLRGEIRAAPLALSDARFAIDAAGRHFWGPIAPVMAVEARFSSPALRWRGHGYFDANSGDEPLEVGFRRWTWSRAHRAGAAEVCYEALLRRGGRQALALRFGSDGGAEPIAPPPLRAFGSGFWGVAREARLADGAGRLEVWEDTPFYTRSRIRQAAGDTICETLDLDRVAHPIVRAMLPARMPRRVIRAARPS